MGNKQQKSSTTNTNNSSGNNNTPPPVSSQKSKLPLDIIRNTCFNVEKGPQFISKEARNYKASCLNQHSILDLRTNSKLLNILRKRIINSSSSDDQVDNNNSIIIESGDNSAVAADEEVQHEEQLLLDAYKKLIVDKLNQFYKENDKDETIVLKMKLEEERAFACMLGLMIGDAMGAPQEFSWYKPPPKVQSETEWLVDKIWKKDKEFFELTSIHDEHVWKIPHHNKFFLKVGQFTDDSSMALCVMDTLVQLVIDEIYEKECCCTTDNIDQSISSSTTVTIEATVDGISTTDATATATATTTNYKRKTPFDFDGREMRLRFLNWVYFGYNNTFGKDDTTPGYGSSCGLGSNVKSSIIEFMKEPTEELTKAGDLNTSGNGSIMRLAPIPIFCLKLVESIVKDNNNNSAIVEQELLESALTMAHKHSKTTHQGDEAAELCRLMTFIIISAVKYAGGSDSSGSYSPLDIKKHIFSLLECGKFQSSLQSVNCLIKSEIENGNVEARNWNWKDLNYQYCPARLERDRGYIGSYAMDAMAMALHNLYYTDSFEDAILLTANMAGDSDTVSAIVGQMAGAIYGLKSVPIDWIEKVLYWDYNGDILLRLSIIYNHSF